VIRVEADYLHPLRTGDRFHVTASLERVSKLRFGFLQDIYRLPDHKPVLKAKVFGTSLNAAGQPKYFQELEQIFS
jgi:acyl-CoA thioester hydrolase